MPMSGVRVPLGAFLFLAENSVAMFARKPIMKKVGTVVLYRARDAELQRDVKARTYFRRDALVVDATSGDTPNSMLCCKNGTTTITCSWLLLEVGEQRVKTFRSCCCVLEDTVKIRVYNHDRDHGELQFATDRANVGSTMFSCMYLLSSVCSMNRMCVVIVRVYLLAIAYLTDNPMGLKQSRLLKTYFAEFFVCVSRLQMRAATSRYAWLLPPKYHLLCLRVFNTLVSHLYRHTVRVLVDCIGIFGGRNYNALKKRTDRVEYSPDVIILASIVFSFAALVLYNIIGFYILAAASQALEALCEILMSTFVLVLSTDTLLSTGSTIKVQVARADNYVEYDVVGRNERQRSGVVACMQAVLRKRGLTKTRHVLKSLLLGDVFSKARRLSL